MHVNANGERIAIAVLVEEGNRNAEADKLLRSLHGRSGDVRLAQFGANAFLPKRREYFRYPGSETVPPCREGVSWIVLADPMTLSGDQIDRFAKLVGKNARPLQALNGRMPLRSR